MTATAATLTTVLGWGTLLLQLFIVLLVVLIVREWRSGRVSPVLNLVRGAGLQIAGLAALVGSGLTLLYSEVFGFLPCGLCWLQRVFLYPQVFLLAVALVKKDAKVGDYIIALSIPGFLIALYQHFIQMGGNNFLPCPATPGAVDCGKRLIFELGYITFPLMAATLFAFLITLGWLLRQRS